MLKGVFVLCELASLTLFVGGVAYRRRMGARSTLLAMGALTVSLLCALLSGIYLWDGPQIAADGAGPMGEALPRLEKMIADRAANPPPKGTFRVWVLGDSTHQSRGENRTFMVPALRQTLRERNITDIEIDGIQWPGFNGFEFYFLLNRLIDAKPDLVVMPLNLRAFGANWYRDGANTHPMTERYCLWSEIPRAVRLSFPARRVTWPGIVLRKFDWWLWDSRAEAFFNGLKLRAEPWMGIERTKAVNEEREIAIREFEKLRETTYAPTISPDHPVLAAHHALDRLAYRRGIGAMYYTVQTPDLRANQDWNFTTLRWELSEDPGVRFITMTDLLPPEDFASLEHFYFSGMKKVAGKLVDEMMTARDDREWRESLERRHIGH